MKENTALMHRENTLINQLQEWKYIKIWHIWERFAKWQCVKRNKGHITYKYVFQGYSTLCLH